MPDSRTVYRSKQQARLFAVTTVAFVALMLGELAQLLSSDRATTAGAAAGTALILALAGAAAWFGRRLVRTGVYVGPHDIEVLNPVRCYRIRWEEIERFSVQPVAWGSVGRVHLRDGVSVGIWGIQGRNRSLFKHDRWAEDPIDDLNRLLEQRRR